MPAGALPRGEYIFQLSVRATDGATAAAVTHALVEVVADTPPTVEIDPLADPFGESSLNRRERANANERFVIEGRASVPAVGYEIRLIKARAAARVEVPNSNPNPSPNPNPNQRRWLGVR